jgi:simple sugar transport system substrate-binding protein
MSKSAVAGYVAAFPIPEVVMGINAFMRGMRGVNPKAQVKVVWTSSWYDPGREREAAETLISQGADVVTHHTDSTAVVQAAEARNVYAIGYHSDMSKYGPKAHLTAVTHQWGAFYTKTVNDAIAGTWKPGSVWGGIKDGMIRMAPFNAAVPKDVQDLVEKTSADIASGKFHPFMGPVRDNAGKERLAAGQVMSDEALSKMDYYVEGVQGSLPK